MDIARAEAFVTANGSPLEVVRFAAVVRRKAPAEPVVGGFPFGLLAGKPSSINDTHTALSWLEDLGLLDAVVGRRAVAYLLAVRDGAGLWDEDDLLLSYEAPPWATPDDEKTIVYLTAHSAYWLGRAGKRDHPAFVQAAAFLASRQDEAGKIYGFLHSSWLAASVFAMAGGAYAKATARALAFLASRPVAAWADSQLAWALSCLGAAGVSRDDGFVSAALAELDRRQRPDGGWMSEDGPAFAVNAVIDAVKAWGRFGFGV